MGQYLNACLLSLCLFVTAFYSEETFSNEQDKWFELFKSAATDQELYRFLYNMPKGGDLHHHSSGSNFPKWWFDLATDQKTNGGYTYYTRTKLNLCRGYGTNEFGFSPQTLLFHNISAHTFSQLSECEQQDYKQLETLTAQEKSAWMQSIWLDKTFEGRDEFFQTHWQRLNELTNNPYIAAEMFVKNMKAFSREGVIYLESQYNLGFLATPSGEPMNREQGLEILKTRLAQPDALATGVTVRLQYQLLRFLPNAEQQLKSIYQFVAENSDIYVGINMVGREDNDKGYPLRFLSTLRELRREFSGVRLSIHAGEVDEPNFHIRDTLLLGADRIGHGVNLLSDPETTLAMRHGPYLIEVNLISNLLLEYINQFNQHPFPEFLRIGIPVALSTDDRGMWHSNLTDEFFVAVKSYNLSWSEILMLGENSIRYGFTDPKTNQALMAKYKNNIELFKTNYLKSGLKSLSKKPVLNQFISRQFPSLIAENK